MTGLFELTGRYATEGEPQFCDVDGDGKLDMLIGTLTDLIVRRGHGDGTFDANPIVTPLAGPFGGNIIGDFDGDGRCDVVNMVITGPGHLGDPGPMVYFQSGQPNLTFQTATPSWPVPASMNFGQLGPAGVADVDGTGPQEAVIVMKPLPPSHGGPDAGITDSTLVGAVSCNATNVNVWSNFGNLGSTTGAIGDVDGDHHVDILASHGRGPPTPVTLLRGDGTGAFVVGPTIGNLAGYVADVILDLDGDGFPDVATHNESTVPVPPLVFWGDANLSFQASSQLTFVKTGDFDGDGRLDLVSESSTRRGGCIRFGAGGRVFGNRMLIVPAEMNANFFAAVADFNGDGVTDLVIWKGLLPSQPSVTSIYISTAKHAPSGVTDVQCGALCPAQCSGPKAF